MRRASFVRLFWIAAATTLVAAALLALAAVVAGAFDSTDAKILGSLGTLLLAGAVATVGGSLREGRRARPLATLLLAGSPVLAAIALAAIWKEFEPATLGRAAGSAYVLLGAALVVGTGRVLVGDRPRLAPFFLALCVSAGAGAVLTVVAIGRDEAGSGYGKTVAAAWILAVLSYLLIPIARRLAGPVTAAGPRALDLRAGADAPGTRVRLVEGETMLAAEAIVVVLAGEAQAGTETLAIGDAVVAPAGTRLVFEPGTRALLVGR